MRDPAEPAAIRASDDERNQVYLALGEHLSTGRLDLPEYESRMQGALEARTVGDLADLLADLPDPRPEFVVRLVTPPTPPIAPIPPIMSYPHAPLPHAPHGVDPFTGLPYSDKNKFLAGLLQIFFGAFGIGRFYAGRTGIALTQLLMTVLTLGVLAMVTVPWGIIDGIIILTDNSTDGKGRKLR
jgi:TM2 domain-containing membrane protein YozV